MNGMNKLEQKFGKYAVRDLMKYVSYLYAAGIVIQLFAPWLYSNLLSLNARAILHGQIWRIVTFLIYPPIGGSWIGNAGSAAGMMNLVFDLIFNMLIIYCYRNIGAMLERVWGTFRFNIYFLMGVVGHVLAALIIYLVLGKTYILTTDYLNFSLFLAVAITFPEARLYLSAVLPTKANCLAIFNGLFHSYGLLLEGAATRVAIIMSLLNVVVFFLIIGGAKYNPKELKRKQQFRTQMNQAVREAKTGARHRCAVCGRTDLEYPDLTFRYCSKCEGDFEYCQDHLYTHQHVTRGGMDPRQAESNAANKPESNEKTGGSNS